MTSHWSVFRDFVAPAALKAEVGLEEEEERARRRCLLDHATVRRAGESPVMSPISGGGGGGGNSASAGGGIMSSYEATGYSATVSAISQASFGTTADVAVLAKISQVLKSLNGNDKVEVAVKRQSSTSASLSSGHTKLNSVSGSF